MNPRSRTGTDPRRVPRHAALALAAALGLPARVRTQEAPAARSLEETRLVMGKWIETQQILSKERNEWQQGKEVLLGRLEVVHKEISTLEEKIREAQSAVSDAEKKREALLAENGELKSVGAELTDASSRMEGDVRRLLRALPEPVATRLAPLSQRMPEDPAKTKVSAAERFQNILGILNEVNKANNDITVNYEVHDLADGKPSEVQAIYIGLAQAYFVSARGEAGIGRPGPDGWTWEPSKTVAPDVLNALEIFQGKQSPAFVPLPVKLQ
jgi:FtsZ-binding cell division protein ZapB